MIGRSGERGSGISVLVAQHDDDIVWCFINCCGIIPILDMQWGGRFQHLTAIHSESFVANIFSGDVVLLVFCYM